MNAAVPSKTVRLAWFAAGAAAAMIGIYRLYGWVQIATGDLQGPDFFSFYAAARLLAARGGAHLYEVAAQQHFQDQVTSAWPGHFVVLPYLHPPYYTLVIRPLAALNFHQAYLAMAAANVLLFLAAVLVMGRAGGLRRSGTAIAGALTFAFLPIFVVFVQGQSDLFILVPLCLSFMFWTSGRPGWAGACAGLAVAKPQLVLMVPMLFLVRRSWSALAGYASTLLALVVASLPAFGVDGWLRYLGVITPWIVAGDRNFPITGQTVYSLRGLLEAGPGGRPFAVAVLAIASLATVASLAWRATRPALDFAFVVAASLVLSPYQNLHDLSLLVLPGIAVVAAARRGGLRSPRVGILVVLVAYTLVDLTAVAGPQAAALAAFAVALYLAWERLGPRPRAATTTNPAT